MCGIAGIYNLKKNNLDDRKIIKEMTDEIAHRGPDDEGHFIKEKVALGHRRLSILDLSALGHQPMFFAEERFVIVFNGEIYNYLEIRAELLAKGYRFRSQSDTEVILAAYQEWSETCLGRFNGMFAFAIYDRKKDVLFCARDRLGVKPFYYLLDQSKFVFASEIKAILKYPGVKALPNDSAVYDYLLQGQTDHNENTFFSRIKQLLPGHFLLIKAGKLKITRYWQLDPKNQTSLSEKETIEEFKNLFTDAVKLRLRSDVPIGSCLSGGLDSSSIVTVANQMLRGENAALKQKTFSSIFRAKEFSKANEKKYIDLVVKKTKVKPYYVESSPKKLLAEIKNIVYHQDEPFMSTSIYAQWNVFRLARENNVVVMLDGQGADEMLAGYINSSFGVYLASLLKQGNLIRVIREFRGFRKNHPGLSNSVVAKGGFFSLLQSSPFLTGVGMKTLNRHAWDAYDPAFRNKYFHPLKTPAFYQDSFKDFNYWLVTSTSLPALLRYEDRDSMAFAIESRVPFLDYRLMEFVFSLPNDLLIKNGVSKYILREAMKDLLPAKIYARQDKIGFETPEATWFRQTLKKDLEKIIHSDSFRSRKYFNHPKVAAYFDAVLAGKIKFDFTIWRWVCLEMWFQTFID